MILPLLMLFSVPAQSFFSGGGFLVWWLSRWPCSAPAVINYLLPAEADSAQLLRRLYQFVPRLGGSAKYPVVRKFCILSVLHPPSEALQTPQGLRSLKPVKTLIITRQFCQQESAFPTPGYHLQLVGYFLLQGQNLLLC